MAPALLDGDYLFCSRAIPKAGDIVLVKRPDRLIVKRLMGTPGDDVAMGSRGVVRLEADQYFVISDNLDLPTIDSRQFGPVSGSDIVGTARVRYWPLSRIGRVASSLPE